MSQERKDLLRRYYREVWEGGNAGALDDLLTDNYVEHNPPRDLQATSRARSRPWRLSPVPWSTPGWKYRT